MKNTQLGKIILLTVHPEKVQFSPVRVRIVVFLPTPQSRLHSQLGKIIHLTVQIQCRFTSSLGIYHNQFENFGQHHF